jgi:hypothetical protein
MFDLARAGPRANAIRQVMRPIGVVLLAVTLTE